MSAERTWMSEAEPPPTGVTAAAGCTFTGRCRVAMAECAEAVPPLYRTANDRAVACYRYRDAPELAASNLGDVLAGGVGFPAVTSQLSAVDQSIVDRSIS
jgi:hypothetical protein